MFLRIVQRQRDNIAISIRRVANLLARFVRTHVIVLEAFAGLSFIVFGNVKVNVGFVVGVVRGEVAFDAPDLAAVCGEEVFELPTGDRGWDGGIQAVRFAVLHVLFLVLDCLTGRAQEGDVETRVVGGVERVVDGRRRELEDHVATRVGHGVPVRQKGVGVDQGQVGVPGVLGLVPC